MTYDNEFRILFRFAIDSIVAEQEIDIGLIQELNTKYTVSTTGMGIPTQPAQNSFQMDTGVTRTYTFDWRRVNPAEYDNRIGTVVNGEYERADPKKWSNGMWVYIMKRFLVNKWQMETDGCKIYYLKDNEDYPAIQPVNCYVSDFKVNQNVGDVQTLTGNITFTIGATNILKESKAHTVIFDANYSSTGVSGVVDDNTNMVKVTDESLMAKPKIPQSWMSRAITLTGWHNVADSYWAYDKHDTNKQTEVGSTINLTEEEITIYVIWREHRNEEQS